jgi:hypothetical protein
MPVNAKDLRVGLLFVAIGLGFGVHAWLGIRIGTPARMGPGFFPVVLSVVLVGLGALIAGRAIGASPSQPGRVAWRVSWRGLALVLAAPVVFGLTIRGLGFVPAVAAAGLIASLASRDTGLARAVLIALGLTALCVAIFIYGVGVPTPLFGPWLGG